MPYAARRNHWNNHVERHGFAVPDRPAFRFQGRTTTWAQLAERVRALADAMSRRGVSAGDRVAVLTGNRPEFMETVLAANRLGAIAVPVNFRLTGPEAAYILENSGARLLVVDDVTAAVGRDAVTLASEPLPVVVVDGPGWSGTERYESLMTESGPPAAPVDVPEDTPALIVYTSGTTGRPKGAVLTHQNLQGQALTIIRAFQLTGEGEVNLVAAPMFHIGAIGSIVPLILIGGTLVVLPSGAFDAGQVLGLLERERITSVFLVPTQWQALCTDPSVADRDLSALHVTSWGAAPASDTLLRRMAEVFPGALNVAVFGQTEMSPVTCVLEGRDALRKLGSVGRLVPTVAARVVDGEMNDVPPGTVGEIVYRGPTLMAGYWRNPDATAEAFAGGWFHSGDLVRVDEEGFVHVVDRAKDMIISGGENVYCAEVENVLEGHPAIREVSVVGRPHPKWGETPVAVVALHDPAASLDIEELRSWAARFLARYKLPTDVILTDALPRNASGKVVKDQLRQRVGQAPPA
ncbi:long-chain fatty acid--CoA ligase [Geodermatophilus sp. TF02-6]|uniref:AMP-binding protein n=1 Tax=Geodermatophilus sp. TF02-6 TaxID=2250575 RepID=UPI000DEACB83|nr:AMP-binding protein [Geodermatophilus sp. TF02-6]RBY82975.1 long-chain fatty acid--CoA ligase [Geodermatophilus sp. TF02-6]